MLEIIRDSDENILAVCEWDILNETGRFDCNGKFLLISEIEINKNLRGKGFLRKIITRLVSSLGGGNIERVGFVRGKKYPSREMRIYPARRFGG